MCVVFHKVFGSNRWTELKRTECVMNNLSPEFSTKVPITYHFEEQQHLKFCLYDIDSNSHRLDEHDFLGEFETTLGQMVSSVVLQKPLVCPGFSNCGEIILTTEELSSSKEELRVQFNGRNLENRHWFGSISPFLEFYKTNEGGKFQLVHRTDKVRKTTNPVWPAFTVQLRSFCNCDYDRNIMVICKDYANNGNHKTIGQFYTTVRKLTEGPGSQNNYQVINEDKQRRKGSSYHNSGEIFLNQVEVRQVFSFLDYLKGGTEINAFIAIDFTGNFINF